MSGAKLLETYDDFRGGEFGLLGGKMAQKTAWTGRNVNVYRDGSIGARDGLQDITPTGQANGAIACIGSSAGVNGGNEIWYAQGVSIFQFIPGGARSSAYTGAIASGAKIIDQVPINGFTQAYIVVPADKGYLVDHTAKTVTALTGSPNGRAIALYGDRLIMGASGAGNRLRYSDAANPNSWPALNFIDVGSDSAVEIRALYVMRDFLVIVKASGETWILTGVPGVNETLRRVTQYEEGGGIYQTTRGHIGYDGALWSVSMHEYQPAVQRFNGARWETVADQGFWSDSILQTDVIPPEYGTTELAEAEELMFVGNNRALLRRLGVFSRILWEVSGQSIVGWCFGVGFGALVLSTGGAAGATPKFYWHEVALDAPPSEAGGAKGRWRTTDAGTRARSFFTMSDWWAKAGETIMVRHIVVDFTTYVDAGADNNHFDLDVSPLYKYEQAGNPTATTQSFDAAQAGTLPAGSRRRKIFSYQNSDRAHGFKINFDNLKGVKIDHVEVWGVVEPARLS